MAIVGEAINHFRKTEPDISIENAQQIVSFRDRLIHSYDSLDISIIWLILQKHLKPIKEEVQNLLER